MRTFAPRSFAGEPFAPRAAYSNPEGELRRVYRLPRTTRTLHKTQLPRRERISFALLAHSLPR